MMRKQFSKLCAIVLVVALVLCMLASCAGEQGPAGPQGEQGLQGVQGPQGEKGETGAQGPQGEKGETGAQGPQGEKGDKGDKGDKGEAGLPGVPGAQGPQGEKGDKGDKGDTGATGAQGPQGEKGETGKIGFLVRDYTELKAASKVSNSYIILVANIENTDAEPFVLTDETVTLNLNGYAITGKTDIKIPVSAPVKNENGASAANVSISAGGNSALVPVGALLEEGVNELVFSVVSAEEPFQGVEVAVGGESISYEIDVAGLAAGNDKFVTVNVQLEAGLDGVQVYHNGAAMGAIGSGNENGEFEYNAGTGVLTIKTKSFSQFDIVHYPYDALIGNVGYESLAEALAAAKDGDEITLLKNAEGNGIPVAENRKLTIDFNGFTYNVTGDLVGSTGTVSQAAQLLKGATVVFKNGTLTSTKALMMIQNYSNLTLENMTIDGTKSASCGYVLSTNCGNVTIKGNTNLLAGEGKVALDVMHWENAAYKEEGSHVVIDETMTGKVVGAIAVYCYRDGKEIAVDDNGATLIIKAGAFTDLASAIKYAADGATIKLAQNVVGPGIKVDSGKNITVDFGGYNYDVDDHLVGSTGTETNGLQLLKDSTITFKNGEITSNTAKILIQNYSNLTLDNMTVSAGAQCGYVVSNNNGNVVIKDTTITAAEGKVAFDVYSFGSYTGANVTVTGNSVINGKIEVSSKSDADTSTLALKIESGTINGEIKVDDALKAKVSITGGAFTDLASAIQYAADGATIKLAQSVVGPGIKVASGTNITVDFGGYTYEVNGNLVGSTGTETNGLQLLKDSTITFKNGKLTSDTAKILIQNYSNLTLDNMTVSAGAQCGYVVSNNNGNVVIKDTTINAAEGKVAFDVCRYASYIGPNVTVEGNSVINGKVEISSSGKKEGARHQLNVTGGTFNGEIYNDNECPDFVGNITGGIFAADPSAYVAVGYQVVNNSNVFEVKKA